MLLTITCTRAEGADWAATDLGYLLHKNPARAQVFEQSYGSAHVLYPEATEQRCTAALLLEIDPVRLVRGRSRGTPEFSLGQYVNDRPYAASSLLSVAIAGVFKSALHGQCAQRPELAATALPLRIELPAVPCRGGAEAAERMFAPLGWRVSATPIPLDPAFPEWGESHYVRLELTADMRVADALSHLYVLLPVLDGSKHYWLGDDEVDKLLRAGEGWLATHPERAWITRRYLARRQSLVRTALARLAEIDDATPESLGAIDDVDDELSAEAMDSESATTVTECHASAAIDADNPAPAGPRSISSDNPDNATRDETTDSAAATDADGGGSALAADGSGPTASASATAEANTPGPRGTSAYDSGSTVGSESPDSAVDSAMSGGESTIRGGTTSGENADAASADEARTPSLAVLRRTAVIRALHEVGARRVLDLGCGEGVLLRELLPDRVFTEIVGVDVSVRALRIAQRRLHLDRAPRWVSERISLRQGALTYADAGLRGYDAAVLMEVIEHVDPARLAALEHTVFGVAAPGAVIVTTPNGEYNALYETLPAGKFRHADHRFEWSRAEFATWARRVVETYGYTVGFEPVGPEDPEHGSSTQMAVFRKASNR